MKRLKKEEAVLVVVDYQEKIMPVMYDVPELLDKTTRMIKGTRALEVPVVVTQQYTKGLGPTVEPVAEALGEFMPIEKVTFSCMGEPDFVKTMEGMKAAGRSSVILIGIETHICVEQTALDLLRAGFDVYLISDCVQSRSREHSRIAQEKMARAGVVITSYESALYEMLETAKAPAFKAISAIVK